MAEVCIFNSKQRLCLERRVRWDKSKEIEVRNIWGFFSVSHEKFTQKLLMQFLK